MRFALVLASLALIALIQAIRQHSSAMEGELEAERVRADYWYARWKQEHEALIAQKVKSIKSC